MKRTLLLLIATLACYYANAQNTPWSTSGNIGIGTNYATALLSISPTSSSNTNMSNIFIAGANASLGYGAGAYLYPFEFQYNGPNVNRLQITPYRRVAGTDWSGTAFRLQFAVDNSYTNGSKSFIEIGASDPATVYGGFISLGTGGSDRLCINSTGNVLIGQTTQSNSAYILDVKGTERVNSVVVNGTGADFVFEPTYHLNSLSWLAKYINQNHHLPEIASAKQMQADGLNLGDNQIKLLQKVEELTLYLIEKDKKQKEDENKLQSQQTEIKSQQEEINLLKQQVQSLIKTVNKYQTN